MKPLTAGANMRATLYLHYPCFDGVVSAVLATHFLEAQGWRFERFRRVNYQLRTSWLETTLDDPCAVVDFLYHPDARFWADHHRTTFLSEPARAGFERRSEPWLNFDDESGSCAMLLWRRFFAGQSLAEARYGEMAGWADKIDSARYDSVQEAILGEAPALQISFSLAQGDSDEYCSFLIHALRRGTLSETCRLPEVRTRFERVRALFEAGLERFRQFAHLEPPNGDIVVFDVESRQGEMISRYAPFYFFPKARYSIGLQRSSGGARITAMRNPWLEFPTAPLDKIFERYGGGGHPRVGALLLGPERIASAQVILKELIAEIRRQMVTVPAATEGGRQ